MVRHIVLWTFCDGVDKDAEFARLERGFAAFAHKVPGMRRLKLYRGYQGWDVCLASLHESRDALRAYQEHPDHLEMKKLVAATREKRASCDFDLPDGEGARW